ncbi:OmpA family protein [Thiotrichales bacterium 19S11-10]|nr:OmpA family protein [Thiotrichales bacterium 19S11-10]MCF6807713.1 OmpA family protein [Thiotrichales bacterium 19S9-11]MCF6811682.1 OmpA family protein [Thiotrichales bacterium 19S9-12]
MFKKASKLSALCACIILAGCASKGAPIVDADGTYGSKDGVNGLGPQHKNFSSEELAKMVSDPNSYTWQQRNDLMRKIGQMPVTVYFAFNSYYLKKPTREGLDNTAKLLSEYPKQILRIEGHTDPRGSESYNLNLGQKRADSVKNYLLKHGASKDQICTVSYGELRPAASPEDFGGNWKKAYDLDRRAVLQFGQSCQGA